MTFDEYGNVIKNQTSTISTLRSFEKNMNSGNSRNLEAKKFFYALEGKLKNEIKAYLDMVETHFIVSSHKVKKEE